MFAWPVTSGFFMHPDHLVHDHPGGFGSFRCLTDISGIAQGDKCCKLDWAMPLFVMHWCVVADDAEMVFCPYNYLLDPVVRSAMNITVDNAILIFDEAHNIEDTAR